MQDAAGEVELRDEEGGIRSEFLHAVVAALDENDAAKVRELTLPLHEADLADLIELLRPEQRGALITTLGKDFDAAALPELDEAVRDQVLEVMPAEQVAEALQQLDSDDAVYLSRTSTRKSSRTSSPSCRISSAPRWSAASNIRRTPPAASCRPISSPCRRSGRWGRRSTICARRKTCPTASMRSSWSIPAYHLIGSVALNRLLRSKRPVTIESITDRDIHPIPGRGRSGRGGAPVRALQSDLGAGHRRRTSGWSGVITADDVVEVVQEEASEDILRMGGVAGESCRDSVWQTTRHRFTWLLANLVTAILASFVISLFEATIEQMVALAVLMPIVASMGGNAGTQTMTVAVRALAMQDLGPANALRVIVRESAVGAAQRPVVCRHHGGDRVSSGSAATSSAW